MKVSKRKMMYATIGEGPRWMAMAQKDWILFQNRTTANQRILKPRIGGSVRATSRFLESTSEEKRIIASEVERTIRAVDVPSTETGGLLHTYIVQYICTQGA